MLVIKKMLDFQDFDEMFSYELDGMTDEARRIIYDFLSGTAEYSEEDISDFIRYDVNVLSVDDIIHDYDYMMDEEELDQAKEDDAVNEYVENFLNDYTTVLGMYEEEGETFYVFNEF